MVNSARPQATQERNRAYFASSAAFTTYETSLQPDQPENFLDNFDTADEALAYVNDPANEAELLEEDDAQKTHARTGPTASTTTTTSWPP